MAWTFVQIKQERKRINQARDLKMITGEEHKRQLRVLKDQELELRQQRKQEQSAAENLITLRKLGWVSGEELQERVLSSNTRRSLFKKLGIRKNTFESKSFTEDLRSLTEFESHLNSDFLNDHATAAEMNDKLIEEKESVIKRLQNKVRSCSLYYEYLQYVESTDGEITLLAHLDFESTGHLLSFADWCSYEDLPEHHVPEFIPRLPLSDRTRFMELMLQTYQLAVAFISKGLVEDKEASKKYSTAHQEFLDAERGVIRSKG